MKFSQYCVGMVQPGSIRYKSSLILYFKMTILSLTLSNSTKSWFQNLFCIPLRKAASKISKIVLDTHILLKQNEIRPNCIMEAQLLIDKHLQIHLLLLSMPIFHLLLFYMPQCVVCFDWTKVQERMLVASIKAVSWRLPLYRTHRAAHNSQGWNR